MSIVATRRLIAASASLDPAERALLNLWINRGLDDPALARMTGMSTEAIAARRETIVEHLSEELGLPPAQIRAALGEMAASSVPERGEPLQASPGSSGQASGPSDVPPAGPGRNSKPRSARKRGFWMLLSLALLLIVIVLVLAVGSGPSKHRSPNATMTATAPAQTATTPAQTATTPAQTATIPAQTATTPTTPTTATTPTAPARTTTTVPPRHLALVALPGGDRNVSGFVDELGKPGHLRLRLTVRGLPPARGGHYEVWLYNSILDSRAIGSLPAGVHRLTLPLGRHAHLYHWIDISFQPRGTIDHSGESVLRATNPDQTITVPATK